MADGQHGLEPAATATTHCPNSSRASAMTGSVRSAAYSGCFGHDDAGALTALGLHALQHRGQDAVPRLPHPELDDIIVR